MSNTGLDRLCRAAQETTASSEEIDLRDIVRAILTEMVKQSDSVVASIRDGLIENAFNIEGGVEDPIPVRDRAVAVTGYLSGVCSFLDE